MGTTFFQLKSYKKVLIFDLMKEISAKEINNIKKQMAMEFPKDPAMQEVHVARKILSKEANLNKMSYIEYIKSLGKKVK